MTLCSSSNDTVTTSNLVKFGGGMAILFASTMFINGCVNPIVFGTNHYGEISTDMRLVNGASAVIASEWWLLLKVVSYGTRHLLT